MAIHTSMMAINIKSRSLVPSQKPLKEKTENEIITALGEGEGQPETESVAAQRCKLRHDVRENKRNSRWIIAKPCMEMFRIHTYFKKDIVTTFVLDPDF